MTNFQDCIELNATSRQALEKIKHLERLHSGDELTDEQAIDLVIGFTMLWATGTPGTPIERFYFSTRVVAMSDRGEIDDHFNQSGALNGGAS